MSKFFKLSLYSLCLLSSAIIMSEPKLGDPRDLHPDLFLGNQGRSGGGQHLRPNPALVQHPAPPAMPSSPRRMLEECHPVVVILKCEKRVRHER